MEKERIFCELKEAMDNAIPVYVVYVKCISDDGCAVKTDMEIKDTEDAAKKEITSRISSFSIIYDINDPYKYELSKIENGFKYDLIGDHRSEYSSEPKCIKMYYKKGSVVV